MRIFGAPIRYIQGPESIRNLGQYVQSLSVDTKVLVIFDPGIYSVVGPLVKSSLVNYELKYTCDLSGRECCQNEINRLIKRAEEEKTRCIVGVGGGKALDTAKAVAHATNSLKILVPTIASNDSPCSSLSVLYRDNGTLDRAVFYPKGPDIVLVDSALISRAPVRFLVSGMGDALATKYEAEACEKSQSRNAFNSGILKASLALASLSSEVVLEFGISAKIAVENGLLTDHVEKVIEAVILLSGIGFESGGVAAAHAIDSGLTVIRKTHDSYHGERVAFGLIVQFVLEGRSNKFLRRFLNFYRKVGLPCSLEQLGLRSYTDEEILRVARKACQKTEPIHNMPITINVAEVKSALLAADLIGKAFLQGKF